MSDPNELTKATGVVDFNYILKEYSPLAKAAKMADPKTRKEEFPYMVNVKDKFLFTYSSRGDTGVPVEDSRTKEWLRSKVETWMDKGGKVLVCKGDTSQLKQKNDVDPTGRLGDLANQHTISQLHDLTARLCDGNPNAESIMMRAGGAADESMVVIMLPPGQEIESQKITEWSRQNEKQFAVHPSPQSGPIFFSACTGIATSDEIPKHETQRLTWLLSKADSRADGRKGLKELMGLDLDTTINQTSEEDEMIIQDIAKKMGGGRTGKAAVQSLMELVALRAANILIPLEQDGAQQLAAIKKTFRNLFVPTEHREPSFSVPPVETFREALGQTDRTYLDHLLKRDMPEANLILPANIPELNDRIWSQIDMKAKESLDKGLEFAIAFFDADDLKRINEQLSKTHGNEYIVWAINTAFAKIQETDLTEGAKFLGGRHGQGGDEMMLFFYDLSKEDSSRLRDAIASMNQVHQELTFDQKHFDASLSAAVEFSAPGFYSPQIGKDMFNLAQYAVKNIKTLHQFRSLHLDELIQKGSTIEFITAIKNQIGKGRLGREAWEAVLKLNYCIAFMETHPGHADKHKLLATVYVKDDYKTTYANIDEVFKQIADLQTN